MQTVYKPVYSLFRMGRGGAIGLVRMWEKIRKRMKRIKSFEVLIGRYGFD